ncbi:hypothetical protein [Anaerovibrio slackiae]|uniref:hypothetical protein n=1 Tax=Anaerovibrio slackiae TaxID=2652309 RepID=UPI003866F7F7
MEISLSGCSLEGYVGKYKIFIDTCSLLCSSTIVRRFFEENESLLLAHQQAIHIPLRVVQEIEKHAENKKNPVLQMQAKNVYRLLVKFSKTGIIEICGDSLHDNFADNAFLVGFTALRVNSNLLLITQDNGLAKDILALNNSRSVRGKNIEVLRFDKKGDLMHFFWQNVEKVPERIQESVPDTEVFSLMPALTELSDKPVQVGNVPGEEEVVYDDKGYSVKLIKKLAAGGEGIIYATDMNCVVKIYKAGNITERKRAKIQAMLSKGLHCSGICFPERAIYNRQQEFVGYSMPTAKGRELQKSVFIKPLFLKYFPGWKKIDTVRLCITILEKFKYLHDRNIIVGDINPANILVVSPEEVYIVDTDSFQIEGYPCPVGTPCFTAKEIQGVHFGSILRSFGNERFALATLLFMIMLPGKPPYTHQGGESIIDNIKKQKFPYPNGIRHGQNLPEGTWRYMWSHLSKRLKDAFYETFQKGGKHAGEAQRPSVDEWLAVFRDYYKHLSNGDMGKNDVMSEELFPTRFKKEPYARYEPCMFCGEETKKKFTYDYVICYKCSNEVAAQLVCSSCGKDFVVTRGEEMYRKNKGASMPSMCSICRDKVKKDKFGKAKGFFCKW